MRSGSFAGICFGTDQGRAGRREDAGGCGGGAEEDLGEFWALIIIYYL